MNRRGFLRMLGVATAAGATAQADALSHIIRQPHSIIVPDRPLLENLGNGVFVDLKTRTIHLRRRTPMLVSELCRTLIDGFDKPELLLEPTPVTRYTDHHVVINDGLSVSDEGIQLIKGGVLEQNGEVYSSLMTLGRPGSSPYFETNQNRALFRRGT